MTKRPYFIAVALLLLPSFAFASIYVGDANLTGFRTTPVGSGVVGNSGWSEASGGFKISWVITDNTTYWSYSYTFTDKDGGAISPDVSHWILEVSPSITAGNVSSAIYNGNFDLVGPQTWTADSNSPNTTDPGGNGGNPNLPATLYGIKLDSSQATYTFDSTQDPIWGDFYAKCGGSNVSTAWNADIGTDPTIGETNFTNWIPVPDTTAIPVPGAALLFGSGLIGLTIFRRRLRG